MILTIIGGDKKTLYLSKHLKQKGYTVNLCGLETLPECECIPLEEAVKISDYTILPLPTSRDNKTVFAPYSEKEIFLKDIENLFDKEKVLYGGNNNLNFLNYYTDPLIIRNAVPTAEGAVMTAINLSEKTIWQSKSIVVGYGRIGKILARILYQMGSAVTVTARKESDIALAEAVGYKASQTERLTVAAKNADFIFNTVPSMVITSDVLTVLDKGCTIIDLASKPGGTDFYKAKELGIKAVLALNLPSLTAPDTAAKLIAEHIDSLISERVKS